MTYVRDRKSYEIYVISGVDNARYEFENSVGGHRIVPKHLFDKYFEKI